MAIEIKNFRQRIICEQNYVDILHDFFVDPVAFLSSPAAILFKGSVRNSTSIFIVTIAGKRFVVKRYNVKNWWVLIKNLWRKSHAAQAWKRSVQLIKLGIKVVSPLAIYEERWGVFYGTSYFIMEYLDGARGCDYFAAIMEPVSDWEQVVVNIVDISRKLYQARLIHRDFQYGNMLIVGTAVYLLDLEHLRQYSSFSPSFKRAYQKDVQHFLDFVRSNQRAYLMFEKNFKEILNSKF